MMNTSKASRFPSILTTTLMAILSCAWIFSVNAQAMYAHSHMDKQANKEWQEDARDAWIDGKAEATLLFNTQISNFDINTHVKDGTVMLSGMVDNAMEKELAEELVMSVDGVEGVVNELKVRDSKPTDDSSEFVDTKIVTVLTSKLLFDSEVSGTDIDVDVDNQVVTLNGTVGSKTEKALALTIAENTNDVKRVVDNLDVEMTE